MPSNQSRDRRTERLKSPMNRLDVAPPLNRCLLLLTAVIFTLAACGGQEKQGVSLEVAAQRPTSTPLPTPVPTAALPDSAGGLDALTGQLLLLQGHRYALFDLATGEVTPIAPDTASYSPIQLIPDQTRGAFVAFPDFGVLDLTTRTTTVVQNRASDPQNFGLSPDGRWLVALTGSFSIRLSLLAADGSSVHNVAAGGGAIFNWAWTADSQLVWWRTDQDSAPQVFDPATDSSAPPEDTSAPVLVTLPRVASPDGTRAALVPIALLNQGQPDPDTCFDSSVELVQAPFTIATLDAPGQTVWSEPGLVASSPHWLDNDRLLFVKVGTGTCGLVQGDAAREVMLLDLSVPNAGPEPLVGPLGNADDTNDRAQLLGRQYGHLYAVSPDSRYVAWIAGSLNDGESILNITAIDSGETRIVLHVTRADAPDTATFIEGMMLRQVVWLE